MRKLEILMNKAITQEKNFSRDNTTVLTENGVSTVMLHGNKIAEVGETWLKLYDGGWRTATTKARLNAILSAHGNGEYVFQKDYQWFIKLNGEVVPFESGIELN